jgi:hypothetical protein
MFDNLCKLGISTNFSITNTKQDYLYNLVLLIIMTISES